MKNTDNEPTNLQTIAEKNDALRIFRLGGHHRLSDGIAALGYERWPPVRQAVIDFNTFTPRNDPHGYHDQGKIEMHGETYVWYIAYLHEC